MTTYRIVRTSMCNSSADVFCNYDTNDINVAHQLCSDYISRYCNSIRCGCIFDVIEVQPIDYFAAIPPQAINQPITVTFPNDIWTTGTNTSAPSISWQYTTTNPLTNSTLIYDNDHNKWVASNTGNTIVNSEAVGITSDVSGATTSTINNNTIRIATEPDIKF